MGTTFQGKGEVRTGGSERQSTLDTFLLRLAALGAQPDEIEAARAAWIESPPDPDEIEWVRHATDAELAHEMHATRLEYDEATTLDGGEAETGGAPDEGSSPSLQDRIDAALASGDETLAEHLIAEHGEPAGEPEPRPELPADVARVDDIINWVGGDAERATVALVAEFARSTQRSTLIETLELIRAAAD